MSVSYIKYATAVKCPVHQMVASAATDCLLEKNYFSKDEVIAESGFHAVQDSVRWDYIARMIEEEGGDIALIPVVKRFWNNNEEQRKDEYHAQKCLAGGHGKKTAGYAMVCEGTRSLVIAKLSRRRNIANGVGKAFRVYADSLVKRDLLENHDQCRLADKVTN